MSGALSQERRPDVTPANPDEGLPLAVRITRDRYGHTTRAVIPATNLERADAIRRLVALADTLDVERQIENDLMLLGVPPFELFVAVSP